MSRLSLFPMLLLLTIVSAGASATERTASPGQGSMSAMSFAGDADLRPYQGMWWSSSEPHTGLAFNVDTQGRWFAAFYLYESDGSPTFLTMQGDAIEYLPSESVEPRPQEPYARVRSRLIRSEGGQCLACPWRPATIGETDHEAEIAFYGRNRAELKVGDWILQLAPLPENLETPHWWIERIALPYEYYVVTISSSERNAIVLAKLKAMPPSAFPSPWRHYFLECADCRTTGGGSSTNEQEQSLEAYLQVFGFRCNLARTICGVRQRVLSNQTFNVNKALFDYQRPQITLIDYGATSARSPAKITIQALPVDWVPRLP